MEIFSWFLFGPLYSLLVLVLFSVAILYFVLGIQNLVTGKRERSRLKTTSGYKAIAISGVFIVALAFATFRSGAIFYWLTLLGF